MVDRDIDHIDMDVGIGTASIPVGAGLAVVLGFFKILFFNDFLALDHTAPAIRADVFALDASGAAAGAGLVVFDLGSHNLLFSGSVGTVAKTQPLRNPAEEFHEQDDRNNEEDDENKQTAEYRNKIIVLTAAGSLSRISL